MLFLKENSFCYVALIFCTLFAYCIDFSTSLKLFRSSLVSLIVWLLWHLKFLMKNLTISDCMFPFDLFFAFSSQIRKYYGLSSSFISKWWQKFISAESYS